LFGLGAAALLTLANKGHHPRHRAVGAAGRKKKTGTAIAIALAIGGVYLLTRKPGAGEAVTQSQLPALQPSLPTSTTMPVYRIPVPGTMAPPTPQVLYVEPPPTVYSGGGGGGAYDPMYTDRQPISDIIQQVLV
jgi:hypothetical protein